MIRNIQEGNVHKSEGYENVFKSDLILEELGTNCIIKSESHFKKERDSKYEPENYF